MARYNNKWRVRPREGECIDCGDTFTFRITAAVRCMNQSLDHPWSGKAGLLAVA